LNTITPAVQPVPLENYGGLVTLARPENVPEGASPRNYDMDYVVGSAQTRQPLENVYSFGDSNVGPNGPSSALNTTITGNPWLNPTNILTGDDSYATATPGAGTDGLDVTAFAFSLANTTSPTGFVVALKGYANSAVTVQLQLLRAGQPVGNPKTLTMPTTNAAISFGGSTDLWGTTLGYADVNNAGFGVRITASSAFGGAQILLDDVTMTVAQTEAATNFDFITTFVAQDGSVKNLSLDADGNFWVEDVTNNPGVLNLAFEGVPENSFASGVNGPDVEYLAFNDLTAGCDVPRQYTPNWTDRISQVGPGAAPVFSATSAAATLYPITNITQPVQAQHTSAYFLQSTGPGSNAAGNVVTIYYADSTNDVANADLVNAFNSGNPVYLYTSFTGGPVTQGPTTALVTSVGLGSPPGQPRQFYYYTYVVPTSAYVFYAGSGHPGYTATFQRTLATMTTSVPVPQLTVGSTAVVTGNSVAAYDASWPITQTPNSGAMAITQTSLTAGVATYSYAVLSGANPTVGQLVTITGTLNANGMLNVVNYAIASVSGTNIGTFTITGFSAAVDYPAEAEEGQATTAGTQFTFEPGLLTLGTSTSPIYGTGTGGDITVTGTGLFLSAGTKQGVVFFITRNGYWTAPSAPATFSIPENSTGINASQIPIGPPNVIARGIAFTESGANNVPGANFFTLPTPVQFIVNGVTYTATSLILNDNTSTTASFFFRDSELLNAQAIDIQGFNLFNLIELGNPGWIVKYDSRNFYGLCQNKIQNFVNLSFDGGYHPGSQLVPLGWSVPDLYGRLLVSPVFGNSYYIGNTSGATAATLGLISQTAYQDAYQQPILNPNTAYSLRVTARIPSGITTGNLCIDLVSNGIAYGSFTLPFAQLTTTMETTTAVLLGSEFPTLPASLLLRVYATEIANGADVEIDRIDVFPTEIPVLATTVFGSYANLLESVDAVTGPGQFISENQQPVNGAVVMYDTFYALKAGSMYSWQASKNLEPAQWDEPEVAQRAGACGVNAFDFGEQWIVEACRNGLYLFEGGQPGKIMQEIYQIWNAINWNAGKSIWVRNDVPNRRLFVGVPLPTPNFWLPEAPANPTPTLPNVILMMNYQGCETGEAIKSSMQLHETMFGSLNAVDLRRKWSIWQIASPYAAVVSTSGAVAVAPTGEINLLDGELRICNGIASSKIYRLQTDLGPTQIPTDDGAPIHSLYTTYGYVNQSKVAQWPLLGLFRKLWTYITHQISGAGTLNLRLLPNTLLGPEDDTTGYYPWTMPLGWTLTDPCTQVREAPLNFAATRTFLEFSTTGRMDISNVVMVGRKHIQNQVTGQR
jgi:hypothetical protein